MRLFGRRWAHLGQAAHAPLTLTGFQDDANPSTRLDNGIVVAKVLHTPEIHASEQEIFQTESKFLIINGNTFRGKLFGPYFDQQLLLDNDYEVHDIGRETGRERECEYG